MKLATKHLALAAMLATIGFTASAQPQNPPAGGPGAMPGHSMMRDGFHFGRDPAQMQKHREERMAERMATFKRALQVTPAQEGAWTAWTQAMRPAQHQRPDQAEMLRMTTPERIDRMRALRNAHIAEQDRKADATKTFYATLSVEQKRVFDTASMKFMGRGMGERGGRHGWHHGG
ncbi:Spy/CpxP family protein refolding chaperone [Caenimonas koreensis]|nr:Spy/CpxP family protein refolding chaperone [Caenimonas koreensis]